MQQPHNYWDRLEALSPQRRRKAATISGSPGQVRWLSFALYISACCPSLQAACQCRACSQLVAFMWVSACASAACCIVTLEEVPGLCMQRASLLVACRWAQPLHYCMPRWPPAWLSRRPVRPVQLELCLGDGGMPQCRLYRTLSVQGTCWSEAKVVEDS